MKIPVIFEDNDILVLDKPAGISVHADGKRQEYTVADYVLENYPQIEGVGEDTIIPAKQEQKIKPKMWKGQIEDPGFAFKTRRERMGLKKTKEEEFKNFENDEENSHKENNLEDESGNQDDSTEKASEVIIKRPGIVHRLDKDTSGVLIIAKNKKSFRSLKEQFQDKIIKKEYVALVYGWPKNDSGIIDAPIARSKADFRKKEIATVTKMGEKHRGEERSAQTRYKVLKKLEIAGEKVALVNFYPLTGRMHQIRVHSKSIGHPLVGDHLYGGERKAVESEVFKGEKVRQLLHAKAVVFKNLDGEEIRIESELPEFFGL